MRKLIILALGGAAVAYAIKSRSEQAAPSAATAGGGYAPGPESAAEEAGVAEPVRDEAAVADTVESDVVVPDAAADDPEVRRQEDAAAAEAAGIGGEPDSTAADVDPELRPVVEGSGDDEETFEEETEDEGR